jgi:phosphoribosylanthranilate isomerase
MTIKVCGVTNEADARQAIEAGATALGFNFWPRSPRYIAIETAEAFVPGLPAGVLRVGVFVNATADGIEEACRRAQLDVAQLHGEACEAPSGIRVWKAVSVGEGFDAAASLADERAEAFLLDAPAGEMHGGTGRSFDWALVREARRRIVLAGGLDASNVARAIAVARPWGVDACSRLEASPGIKDHQKVAEFIRAARNSTT